MVEIKKQDNLAYIEISNTSAHAKIALQGAHVFEYESVGSSSLLWLSDTSSFDIGKAIRGGIPICWPWFGPHATDSTLPNHGFARTSLWEHLESQEISEYETKVVLRLKSSEESLLLWPYHFELYLDVCVGDELKITLTTKNRDDKAFEITQALHSYFKVSDINKVFLEGLEEKVYYDKLDNGAKKLQKDRLQLRAETDRIYTDVEKPLLLRDTTDCIVIVSSGVKDVVVWNPWKDLASKMPDLSDYKEMICVESAQVMTSVTVNPGRSTSMETVISRVLDS